MTIALSLFCMLIVAVSLLGGMLPLASVLNHTRLQVYLSFSAGSMLGAAFFHMMPETVRMGSPDTIRWSALGLLALFFLERFFSFHHHESREQGHTHALPVAPPRHDTDPAVCHEHDHGHGHASSGMSTAEVNEPRGVETAVEALSWGSATFGLAIHSLVGGVALASAIAADYVGRDGIGPTGWGVFFATLLHKPADALTIVTLMIRSGVPKRLAHLVNFGFAMMIPLGVAVFCMGVGRLHPEAASSLTATALAFSAGTFLCIALSDLLPELQFHSHDRLKLSLALLAGLLLMAGTSAVEFIQAAH